ncbi:response regulator transcription factor [Opitutus sp. ER46]|uniref:response regulator transcription factor n=1 Tax=Opitutus sp. ER46 TaxID=2161864 RepID=UPI000D30B6EE|nr:response regulator transcription factor [Opitutus sp. ER46]PTX98919.1 DNA-binding response regulator [Opitutus sp. ER46]
MKPRASHTPRAATSTPAPSIPAAASRGAGDAERRTILIVDDHPFMRAGLAQLIDKQADLRVCGEAGDPAEALRKLAELKVDLVLTDMTMPGRSGIEFIKDVQALYPKMPMLVVSMHDEVIYAERVLRAGARGYIMKEAGGENLLFAIRQVLVGQAYVSPRVSAKILDDMSGRKPRGSNSPIERLSDREFEVFQLIGQGKSTREIAKQLGLSPKTVDVHRANTKEKLGLDDATALVRHAVRWVESQGGPVEVQK